MSEQRRVLRSPVQVWVRNLGQNEFRLWFDEETAADDFTFCYFTQDLSEQGVFLETDAPLPIDSELKLELNLPGLAPVALSARVRWVRDTATAVREGLKPGMGLAFIAPDEAACRAICDYLQGQRS